MRTKILATILVGFAFAGCQKQIKVEVKNQQQTDNTSEWTIKIDRSLFSSTDAITEKSCVLFNDKLSEMLTGFQDTLKVQAKEYSKMCEEMGEKPIGAYQLIAKDSVFMADAQYISMRLLCYSYTGGAHGITQFYGMNYDVKAQKFLENNEILNFNKTTEINVLLTKYFSNPEGCFNEVPTVENLTVLNFSPSTVEFTYGQYVLGAYVCGYVTISVPRAELKGMLLVK